MGILTVVFSSCLAGVGNSMVTESAEKNYNDFRVLTFLINWMRIFLLMGIMARNHRNF